MSLTRTQSLLAGARHKPMFYYDILGDKVRKAPPERPTPKPASQWSEIQRQMRNREIMERQAWFLYPDFMEEHSGFECKIVFWQTEFPVEITILCEHHQEKQKVNEADMLRLINEGIWA